MAAATEPPARALARLYCPAAQRAALDLLLDVEAQIRAPLGAAATHELAHVRLTWWDEECARVAAGEARHPLTRALATEFAGRDGALSRLGALVDLARWDLACATFESRRELDGYCARWSEALIGALARLLLPGADAAPALALGAALHTLELANALGPDAHRGRLRVPLDELARTGLDSAALTRARLEASAVTLVRGQHQRAQQALALAVHALDGAQQAALRPLLVWAGVTARHSRRAVRDLRRLRLQGEHRALLDGWHAWRIARRAARGRYLLEPDMRSAASSAT
jgi:phytoene synthase